MKLIRHLGLGVIFLSLSWSFTAPDDNNCINEVRIIYRDLEKINIGFLNSDKTFYMNYSVRVVTRDSAEDGINESSIEMLASQKLLEVKSKEMELFQDENDVFIVLPYKKMVLRNDPDLKTNKKNKIKKFQLIQDTLFKLSKVKACSNLPGGKKKVMLELNEKGRSLLSIGSIYFVISSTGKYFEKIHINYTPKATGMPGDIVYSEYTFKEVSFDYKVRKPGNKVEKLFISGKQLVSKYEGYTLIDNRYRVNRMEIK